jgi:aspartyl-tRNA(Asn)/glutamyl-tRNA(Gln) amidotransferase subunit C
MSLTRKEVEKIAHLARLELSEQEIPGYAENLSRILALVEQMNAVDTTGVEPMAHPQDTPLRLRPDTVTETDHREEFQGIAPETEAGLYLVPKVIE